jgi:methyl-accepting chemotaxis protein
MKDKVKFTSSLRFKILLPIVLIIIVGTVLQAGYSAANFRARVSDDATQLLNGFGSKYGQEVTIDVTGKVKTVNALSSTFTIPAEQGLQNRELYTNVMLEIFSNFPEANGMYMIWEPNGYDGLDAQLVADGTRGYEGDGLYAPYAWRTETGFDYYEEGYLTDLEYDFFTLSYNSGETYIIDPYLDTSTDEDLLMFSITTPLKVNGTTRGIYGADILITPIHERLKEVKPFENGYMVLISEGGYIISSPNDSDLGVHLSESTIPQEVQDTLLQTQSAKQDQEVDVDVDGEKLVIRTVSLSQDVNGGNWAMATVAYQKDIVSVVTRNVLFSSGIGGTTVLVSVILVFFLLTRATKPISQMAGIANEVSKGNMNIELPKVKSKDEVMLLKKAFESLIDSTNKKIKAVNNLAEGKIDDINLNANKQDELANSIEVVAETLKNFSSKLEEASNKISNGNYKQKVETEGLKGSYETLAEDVNSMVDSIVSKIDNFPTPLINFDKELKVIYANKLVLDSINKNTVTVVGTPVHELKQFDSTKGDNVISQSISSGSVNKDKVRFDVNNTVLYTDFTTFPIKNQKGEVVGVTELAVDSTLSELEKVKIKKQSDYQSKFVSSIVRNINTLAEGSFDLTFEDFESDEDTHEIHEVFNTINSNLEKAVTFIKDYVSEISDVLETLSNSNLDVEVTRQYIGDFAPMKDALNKIIASFNDVIAHIYQTSTNVTTRSAHMSESSQNLSQGATEQAASVEEISATVTEVAAQVQENANNAEDVNNSAKSVSVYAEESNQYMMQLTTSMKEIQKSTANIQKVLKMINDIAFQTNILSLNAAVEAARAGQHGKGFAVIAEDVRNLALKSASAADETNEMLDSIVSQINDSVEFTKQTAVSLDRIVEGTNDSVRKSSEVALASNEQAVAIGQITLSLDQISQVVQSTSVNAQQGAATSEQLSSDAKDLQAIVSNFKIKNVEIKKIQRLETKTSVVEEKSDTPIISLDDDFNF